MSIASMMESDIDAVSGDVSASIVYPTGTTISGTCSPVSRRDEVSTESVFEFREMEFVAKVSAFTGGIPTPRANVILTCADLSVSAERFFVESRIADMGGVTLILRRI